MSNASLSQANLQGLRTRTFLYCMVVGVCFFSVMITIEMTIDFFQKDFANHTSPAGTFIFSSDAAPTALLTSVLSVQALAAIVACLVTAWLGRTVLRGVIGPSLADFVLGHRRAFLACAAVTAIAFGVTLPDVLVDDAFASSDGLFVRHAALAPLVKYDWASVSSVTTDCYRVSERHGPDDWHYSVRMTLKDGTVMPVGYGTYDVGDPPPRYSAKYPRLAALLSGHPINFDTSGVAAGCSPPDLQARDPTRSV